MTFGDRIQAATKALFGKPFSENASVRRFDGASGRRAGIGRSGAIVPEVSQSLETLRSRSRHLKYNNPWAVNGMGAWVVQTVGNGIKMQSAADSDGNRELIDRAFQGWSRRADYRAHTTFSGLQAEVMDALVTDGEAFIQMLNTPDGLSLKTIPAELIDTALTRDLGDGGYIVNGIEFDVSGRVVAFHIFPEKPTSVYQTYQKSERFDAADILHVFRPMASGQVRGVPWTASIILPAAELDKLLDAILMQAQVRALMAGYITDPNCTGQADFEEDSFGDISLEPATLRRLPPGFDIKFTNPPPGDDLSHFAKLNLRQIAAGLQMPVHLLDGDLSDANYSSLRAGLLNFRARVDQLRATILEPQFLQPVFERWLTLEVLSGRLDLPNFETDESNFEADWLAPAWQQVDPLKDMNATREKLDAGLTSRRREAAKLGCSVADLDNEIAADRAREEALNLTFTGGSND